MKTRKFFVFAGSLFLLPSLISCGGHVHTYVGPVAEVSPNCAETGTEAYYTCETCSKIFDVEKNEIEAPVSIPKDPNTHKGNKSLAVATGYQNSFKVNESIDLSTFNLIWKCDYCSGVALNSAEKRNVSITYPSEGADKFTAEDAKQASVQVTFTLNSYSVSATFHVSKNENAITGLTNLEGHCGYPITNLDALIDNGTISATNGGAITLSIADSETGTYKARSEFSDDYTFNVRDGETSSIYYIKADVKADDEYLSASAGPVKLTITHNEIAWDNSRNDYDFVGCLCQEDNIVKFNKVASSTTDILLANDTATLDLTGTSYNVSPFTDLEIKEISLITAKGEKIDLGKSLNISTSALKEKEIYGDQIIEIVVAHDAISTQIPAGEHTIKVPVSVITAKITTGEEWYNLLTPKAAGQVIKGYYVLANNITVSSAVGYYSSWDTSSFSGIVDGKGYQVTCGQSQFGQFVFLKNATLKNLKFVNNWWRRTTTGYALLAQKSNASNFENITFAISGAKAEELETEYTPVTNYGYLFNNGGAQANAFKDCLFDFEIYKLPCLLSHSNNNTETNTFENCTLKCKELTELYSVQGGASILTAEGLNIEINKEEILDLDEVKIMMTSSDPASIQLSEEYSDYNVDSIVVKVDGSDVNLGTNLTNIVIPDGIKNNTKAHGSNLIYVNVSKGTAKAKLGVPVCYVTSEITSNDELMALTHASGTATTVYGYYVLANDLDINSNYTEFARDSSTGTVNYNVFAGTLDGNNKTITSKSRPYGIFGELNGATIKDLSINDGWCYGGIDMACPVLSIDMKSSTISNVKITMTAKATRTVNASLAISAQNYGWINSRICMDNQFVDCVFDGGTTLNVQTLVGTHASCVRDTFSNCTFNCNSYYCLYQSSYTNLVTTTQDGLTITGTCLYSA